MKLRNLLDIILFIITFILIVIGAYLLIDWQLLGAFGCAFGALVCLISTFYTGK